MSTLCHTLLCVPFVRYFTELAYFDRDESSLIIEPIAGLIRAWINNSILQEILPFSSDKMPRYILEAINAIYNAF